MLTLHLLGGCTLVADGEAITGPAAQRRRLALLALVASSPAGGVSRDKLIAYFWPEEECLGGDPVREPPEQIEAAAQRAVEGAARRHTRQRRAQGEPRGCLRDAR